MMKNDSTCKMQNVKRICNKVNPSFNLSWGMTPANQVIL